MEHETTGCSPNYLMLGREVATPLDVMYEIPSCVKDIPENRWAWDLKEKMELAHTFVRENVPGAMLRQKSLHDQKTFWHKCNAGDEVYVFFPRHLPGQSPKFSNFWRGPFKVLEKCTEVTYKVSCGPRGRLQVIHVDRMRAKKSQLLENETAESYTSNIGSAERNSTDKIIIDSEGVEPAECLTPDNTRRARRPPAWLSDYVTEF